MSYHLHQAGERLDYTVDFTKWLDGDTVNTASWSLVPTLPGQALSESGSAEVRSCMVSGLTGGLIYVLTCTATSGQGRIRSKSFTLRCPRP